MSSVQRYPDLDLLRGLAVLCMIVYHAAYDLTLYWHWDIAVVDGGWWLLARGTANLFLLVSGMSAAVASGTHRSTKNGFFARYARRALYLGTAALVVTLATFIADRETYVRFGILHLITASALLLPLFARLKEGNAIIGAALIAIGPFVQSVRADTAFLLPLGIKPIVFHTVDYFPLIPWFGVILIGFAVGHWIYIRKQTSLLQIHTTPSWLTWPGRHALGIYLWHQPIVLALLIALLGQPA
jgi:uncharacterized membrane protein